MEAESKGFWEAESKGFCGSRIERILWKQNRKDSVEAESKGFWEAESKGFWEAESKGFWEAELEGFIRLCNLMITLSGRGAFYYREKQERKHLWTR